MRCRIITGCGDELLQCTNVAIAPDGTIVPFYTGKTCYGYAPKLKFDGQIFWIDEDK